MASWDDKYSPMFLYEKGGHNYQPQLTNHFKVTINDLADSDQITLALKNFSLPEIDVGEVTIYHGNGKVHYAGMPELSGMNSMSVNDLITKDIEKIIVEWHKLIYDPETDIMGWAGDYKKEGEVSEFGPDGTNDRTWTVYGIWPKTVNFGSFDYSSADVKMIDLTLIYDRAWRSS
jgi:hypothetical protein